jgi:DNA-binding GntR family transcriptional regulator
MSSPSEIPPQITAPRSGRLADVAHRTAQERVEEALRQAILGGDLRPGEPLVLTELSAQLGVSRTPIREAMRALASEGLIDMDSFRSATVHTPTLEEAREIYDLRLILDPIAVRRAVAQITPEELETAHAIHETMLSTDDLGEWVDANREFHRVLHQAARSDRLTSIIDGLRNSAAMQVALSLKAESSQVALANADHGKILQAFRDRDVEAAVKLTEDHLRNTLEVIERFEADSAGAGLRPTLP